MIKVDGREIPTPSDYSVGIQDISKGDRNANGTLIMERITTKRKLELAWKYLSKEDLSKVMNAVSPTFFQVEYLDPQENRMKTGTFYSGDRNAGALDYINGTIRWKNIKFNIVER